MATGLSRKQIAADRRFGLATPQCVGSNEVAAQPNYYWFEMTINRTALTTGLTMLLIALLCAMSGLAAEQDTNDAGSAPGVVQTAVAAVGEAESPRPTLEELKAAGARLSNYHKPLSHSVGTTAPTANLEAFQNNVAPVLQEHCSQCHGVETQEGNVRIDTLNPDLFHGDDLSWWLAILAVLTNGEMPPPGEADLTDRDRSRVIEWLSSEIQVASEARRAEDGHSSFRRMTRYEYNYTLQDLLGLPFDFAKDLPPESTSEDGFQNSSEMLHMSAMQFGTYRESARNALKRATVRGERPKQIYWSVSMKDASAEAWAKQDKEAARIREKHKDDPESLKRELERHSASLRSPPRNTYYKILTTGRMGRASWSYGGAEYAWEPSDTRSEDPSISDYVAIIPPKQQLIVELGDRVPDHGMLRVRIRASRTSLQDRVPSLQLEFGWQASNDSAASVRISQQDLPIDAAPDQPRIFQWNIPLGEVYPRNSVRKISKMGDLPSPSEFVKIVNSSVSEGDVQIDYVEVTAPVYEQWPPLSHTRIFFDSPNKADTTTYAREVLSRFMSRACADTLRPRRLIKSSLCSTRFSPRAMILKRP